MTARLSRQIIALDNRINRMQDKIGVLQGKIGEELAIQQEILSSMGVPTVKAALDQERERLMREVANIEETNARIHE